MKEQIKNIKNKTWIEHGSAEGSKVQFFFCCVENDSFVLAHWWFMVNVYVLWADYQVPGMHREMGGSGGYQALVLRCEPTRTAGQRAVGRFGPDRRTSQMECRRGPPARVAASVK